MPLSSADFGTPLDQVAHIIRMALTPVFLLLSIAALLNVFSARLGLVGDKVEQVLKALDGADADHAALLRGQLAHLRRRSLTLDVAVILAAVAKAAVCAAVLLLFAGALGHRWVGWALLLAFGLAICCALGAILAFAAEMLMAGSGVRAEVAHTRRRHLLNVHLSPHTDT